LWPNYQINETHTLLLLLADANDGRTFRTSGTNLFLKLALSTLFVAAGVRNEASSLLLGEHASCMSERAAAAPCQ
jgi:hypothetical protein